MSTGRPDQGWTQWIPTTVLIALSGEYDPSSVATNAAPSAMRDALIRRANQMWLWQARWWLEDDESFTREALRPPIRMRRTWPRGEQIIAFIDGYPAPSRTRSVRLWPEYWDNESGVEISQDEWSDIVPDIPVGVAGEGPVAMRVVARERLYSSSDAYGTAVIARERYTYPIEVVESLHEAITPRRSDHLDDLVRAGVRSEARSSSILVVSVTPKDWPLDVACSVSAALLENGEVVGVFFRVPHEESVRLPLVRSGWPERLRQALRRGEQGDDRALEAWTIRISGDGARALSESLAPYYWSGTIEAPLTPEYIGFR